MSRKSSSFEKLNAYPRTQRQWGDSIDLNYPEKIRKKDHVVWKL